MAGPCLTTTSRRNPLFPWFSGSEEVCRSLSRPSQERPSLLRFKHQTLLKALLRDKLKEKTDLDIDCLLCISQHDIREEFTIKIHDSLFPTEVSTITEIISVGVQVQNDGDDSQVKAGEYGNNVSLEDTSLKGIPEIPCKDDQDKVLDCDNLSDTTAVGSSRSGSPEDPAEQVIENSSIRHY